MKYDIEVTENDLLALVKSKLPAKLSEIEAEKADGVPLPVPTDEQYFNSTDIDEKVINYDFIVGYGIEESGAFSISAATAIESVYGFLFIFTEQNAERGVLRKKLLRYSWAIKEVFEENFDAFPYLSNIEIYISAPADWQANKKSPVYKSSGVYIKTTLAS